MMKNPESRSCTRRDIDSAALPASVPPLSLQPLVENAVQFALQSRAGEREVALRTRLANGRLYDVDQLVKADAGPERTSSGVVR